MLDRSCEHFYYIYDEVTDEMDYVLDKEEDWDYFRYFYFYC